MTYNEAKLMRDRVEAESKAAGMVMKQFPTGDMGLTPDEVKFTPEWQAARKTSQAAFARLQAFNTFFVKQYKKEIAAERKARGR